MVHFELVVLVVEVVSAQLRQRQISDAFDETANSSHVVMLTAWPARNVRMLGSRATCYMARTLKVGLLEWVDIV